MNRQDFKDVSRIRLRETKALLASRNYSGAYYLCGYVIECALKACIAKQTKRSDFPEKKRTNDSYTHNLSELIRIADLQAAFNAQKSSNPLFEVNWQIVKDWTEESRYQKHTQVEAENLYTAVTDSTNGVLQWIELHW